MAFSLKQLTSGMFSRALLNSNFQSVTDKVNDDLLHRDGDGSSVMKKDLDMDSNHIINVPSPTLGFHVTDKAYVDSADDVLQGNIETAVSGYQTGDANIQSQLTGTVPLEASAFSPISWHDQSVDNSVVIPDNKNAWSFGPTMTITAGQSVTIGTGSVWTIANGEIQQ